MITEKQIIVRALEIAIEKTQKEQNLGMTDCFRDGELLCRRHRLSRDREYVARKGEEIQEYKTLMEKYKQ